MTGKQRLLAAFRGEKPDVVPYAPNICRWFYCNQLTGSLPPELVDAEHPFDVLRHLGAEILARWDAYWLTRTVYRDGEYTEEFTGQSDVERPMVTSFNVFPPGRTERHRKFVTPHGTLTNSWRFSEEAAADFETTHWWNTWEQYDAVRFMLESRDYEFDSEAFDRLVDEVGDDGLIMLSVTESPLKRLFWLAGPENATYFMLDHPEEMQAIAKIHEDRALAFLESVVDHSTADVFISNDNLDSAFYGTFYKDYCDSFFSRAAEIIHSRGKIFMVHACGRTKYLLPHVGASKIDCLEGVTPPPAGDVQLGEVRQLVGYGNFTVNGGMDSVHLEIAEDAERQLHEYTRGLFGSMGDKRHFIFASSCSTSPVAPWRNLVYLRDAAREYGTVD